MYSTAPVATTSGTRKFLTFTTRRFDYGGLFSLGANTRLTAPVPGLYLIGACAEFAANATGNRQLGLRLNGDDAHFIAADWRAAVAGGDGTQVQITTLMQLVAGDYVEPGALQSSTGALNVVAAGDYTPEFWMARYSA